MANYGIVESKELICEAVNKHGFFPPDLAAKLPPVGVMSPDAFSRREWTRMRVRECGDPVVELKEADRLLIHSMYWDQTRDGIIEPIDMGNDRIKGAFERIYVRKKLAEVLYEAALFLPDGYQILGLDGFRDEDIQSGIFEQLRKLLGEEVFKYASPPDEFASHASGGAIDLAILRNGELVNMGVKVDEMGRRAYLHYFEGAKLPEDVAIRDWRRYLSWLLKVPSILKSHFPELVGIPTECWHFELEDTQVGATTVGKSLARYGNAKKHDLLPDLMR